MSAVVPAGWKLVPVEPTREMVHACAKAALVTIALHKLKAIWPWSKRSIVVENINRCWAAMLDAAPPPPANIGADSPSDVHALILRIIPAIVNGLWDARDSGEEMSEIKPFIDRDAAVIVRHIRVALGAPTMVPDATPAEGGSDG